MFNRLPAGSKVEILATKGIILAKRQHLDYCITLFSLNNYFVELWKKEGMEIIGTFHSTVEAMAILEPYLDTLDLGTLLD